MDTIRSISVTSAVDVDRLVATLVLAFSHDAFVRWLLPDPRQFIAYFPAVARLHAATCAAHDGAFHTEDYRGAALWYPPGIHPDGDALGAIFQEAMGAERFGAVVSLFGQMKAYTPGEPHWYLRQVGVDPAMQGRGYGTRLVQAGLDAAERARMPAYLEATSPGNRKLYERLGFGTLGEIRVADSPPVWPMVARGRRG